VTQPFRIEPAGPPGAYKTYALAAPAATHRRPTTCEEIDCEAYQYGWITRVDEVTELGAAQAYYIRRECGRRYTEQRTPVGLTVFQFEAGQRCFAVHTMPLEREPIYSVRDGDWRANPSGARRVLSAQDWLDDFGDHQQRIAQRHARG
jgi:hypothetical protein